jgi:two-component sensor histidine kinase
MRNLYGRHSSSPALSISVEPLELEVTQAVPCGLIVAELLSNAYKHAFPADTPGREIRLSLRRAGDERVECAVCDNGVGIPEGLDLRVTPSLGWSLVRMLAEDQLGGTIGINGGAGTEVVVCFAAFKA